MIHPTLFAPWKRVRNGTIALVATVLIAIVGYKLLRPDESWIDCAYMVVITIGTVGYGEHSTAAPIEKVFTMLLILLSMTFVAYTFGSFIQMLTAGELQKALGQYRMTREIDSLQDHIIICGGGRIGELLADELNRQETDYVLVDSSPQRLLELMSDHALHVIGDATQEDVLIQAGVDRHGRS